MMHFLPSLLGGALIGLGAAVLLVGVGRLAGISGITAGAVVPRAGEWGWRLAFLAGLAAGGWLMLAAHPSFVPTGWSRPLPVVVGAGLLVGVGTRMSHGCTSGHGVCGLSRLSRRSAVAVGVFMAVAALVVALTASRFVGVR